MWINSPGPVYVDGIANFSRGTAPRCLECHATWIESVADLRVENRFKTSSAILGITCERCHGAGGEHVANERSFFHAFRRVAIVNPARLSRARQMDSCAQCHGGLGEPRVSSFSYVSGQRLSDFVALPATTQDATVDVHGNTVGLLSQSRCFLASQMTCLTCHDDHREQRDASSFNVRCLACHEAPSCGLFATQGESIRGQCVECHMPMQPSRLIASSLDGEKEQAMIRTHRIRAYETEEAPWPRRRDCDAPPRCACSHDRAPMPVHLSPGAGIVAVRERRRGEHAVVAYREVRPVRRRRGRRRL